MRSHCADKNYFISDCERQYKSSNVHCLSKPRNKLLGNVQNPISIKCAESDAQFMRALLQKEIYDRASDLIYLNFNNQKNYYINNLGHGRYKISFLYRAIPLNLELADRDKSYIHFIDPRVLTNPRFYRNSRRSVSSRCFSQVYHSIGKNKIYRNYKPLDSCCSNDIIINVMLNLLQKLYEIRDFLQIFTIFSSDKMFLPNNKDINMNYSYNDIETFKHTSQTQHVRNFDTMIHGPIRTEKYLQISQEDCLANSINRETSQMILKGFVFSLFQLFDESKRSILLFKLPMLIGKAYRIKFFKEKYR